MGIKVKYDPVGSAAMAAYGVGLGSAKERNKQTALKYMSEQQRLQQDWLMQKDRQNFMAGENKLNRDARLADDFEPVLPMDPGAALPALPALPAPAAPVGPDVTSPGYYGDLTARARGITPPVPGVPAPAAPNPYMPPSNTTDMKVQLGLLSPPPAAPPLGPTTGVPAAPAAPAGTGTVLRQPDSPAAPAAPGAIPTAPGAPAPGDYSTIRPPGSPFQEGYDNIAPGQKLTRREAAAKEQARREHQRRQWAQSDRWHAEIRKQATAKIPDGVALNPTASKEYGRLQSGLRSIMNDNEADLSRPDVQEKIQQAVADMEALVQANQMPTGADRRSANTFWKSADGRREVPAGTPGATEWFDANPNDAAPPVQIMPAKTPEQDKAEKEQEKQQERARAESAARLARDEAAILKDQETYPPGSDTQKKAIADARQAYDDKYGPKEAPAPAPPPVAPPPVAPPVGAPAAVPGAGSTEQMIANLKEAGDKPFDDSTIRKNSENAVKKMPGYENVDVTKLSDGEIRRAGIKYWEGKIAETSPPAPAPGASPPAVPAPGTPPPAAVPTDTPPAPPTAAPTAAGQPLPADRTQLAGAVWPDMNAPEKMLVPDLATNTWVEEKDPAKKKQHVLSLCEQNLRTLMKSAATPELPNPTYADLPPAAQAQVRKFIEMKNNAQSW